MGVTLKNGSKISVTPIDLSYEDCVRHFYRADTLNLGEGVTVGVIDSGVATNHPDLRRSGRPEHGPGRKRPTSATTGPKATGPTWRESSPPGVQPLKGSVGWRPPQPYEAIVCFLKAEQTLQNYSIAKAIDAGVQDKCDLLNMSLGGGPADTLTADALTDAHNAGIVVFAANGNDDRSPVSFPAANSLCQAVSAFGRKGTFPKGINPEAAWPRLTARTN